ncbi:hypothetical protein CERSUDRAFT_73895 [Gelatoporia subvermispora B]|uniref:Hydrophobin n=1 Tax=Ceriporiopsis subvermispora (strain B) TaxID=914234 RepID=M2QXL8_CERS8|nr:hypothetical protein CERSUDRAFT_73895 [Gelatoporia subvermispora B]
MKLPALTACAALAVCAAATPTPATSVLQPFSGAQCCLSVLDAANITTIITDVLGIVNDVITLVTDIASLAGNASMLAVDCTPAAGGVCDSETMVTGCTGSTVLNISNLTRFYILVK